MKRGDPGAVKTTQASKPQCDRQPGKAVTRPRGPRRASHARWARSARRRPREFGYDGEGASDEPGPPISETRALKTRAGEWPHATERGQERMRARMGARELGCASRIVGLGRFGPKPVLAFFSFSFFYFLFLFLFLSHFLFIFNSLFELQIWM